MKLLCTIINRMNKCIQLKGCCLNIYGQKYECLIVILMYLKCGCRYSINSTCINYKIPAKNKKP